MGNRYIGSTEERINKWMRLCLHYQFDKKLKQEKKLSYYCKKYHVGKYAKKWFDDIAYSVIDREYVINKMNLISEDRMKRDRKLGLHSNRVLIKQIDVPNYNIKYKIKGIKVNDNTILKNVAKSKFNFSDISTSNLIEELQRRTVEKHNNITDKDIKYKIKHRQEYNFKCLDKLKEFVEKYPYWRFTQIIFNIGLAEDRFYEESIDTFEKIKEI